MKGRNEMNQTHTLPDSFFDGVEESPEPEMDTFTEGFDPGVCYAENECYE